MLDTLNEWREEVGPYAVEFERFVHVSCSEDRERVSYVHIYLSLSHTHSLSLSLGDSESTESANVV